MAITRTPWIDDDGSGTTGTILNNAMWIQHYDAIDAAIAGSSTALTKYAKVRQSTAQTIPPAAWTTITWDTEEVDNGGYFSPADPTLFTIPSGAAGFYLVTITLMMAPAGETNPWLAKLDVIAIRLLGYGTVPWHSGAYTGVTIVGLSQLSAGQTLSASIYHQKIPSAVTGGATAESSFGLIKIS